MAKPLVSRIRNRLALMDRTQNASMALTEAVASFTFDDFPISAYDIAGKMLEEAGVRGSYFVCAEFEGRTIDGIAYHTPELLRQVHSMGHEIGCHAFDHTPLGERGAAFARETVKKNAARMRALLGEQFIMSSFAYPYGDVAVPVKRAVSKQFALCRGVQRGLNTGKVDLAQIKVVSLEARHWNELAMRQTIAAACRDKSWMVFLTHDISESPTPYGSTPEMIRITLQLLKDAQVPVMTMKAAAAVAMFPNN